VGRIADAFKSLPKGCKGFIPYITAGDPDLLLRVGRGSEPTKVPDRPGRPHAGLTAGLHDELGPLPGEYRYHRGQRKQQKGCDQAPPIAETSHLRSSLSPPTGLAAGLAADPSGGILATGRSRPDSPLPAHLSGSGSPAPARRAGLD